MARARRRLTCSTEATRPSRGPPASAVANRTSLPSRSAATASPAAREAAASAASSSPRRSTTRVSTALAVAPSSSLTITRRWRAVATQLTSRKGSPGTYSRRPRTSSGFDVGAPAGDSEPILASVGHGLATSRGAGPTSSGRSRGTRSRRRHHTRPKGAAERTSTSTCPTTPRLAGSAVNLPAPRPSSRTQSLAGATKRSLLPRTLPLTVTMREICLPTMPSLGPSRPTSIPVRANAGRRAERPSTESSPDTTTTSQPEPVVREITCMASVIAPSTAKARVRATGCTLTVAARGCSAAPWPRRRRQLRCWGRRRG